MKKILFITAIAFVSNNFIVAQNESSWIKEIRSNYTYIRENLSSFDTLMIPIWYESTEGGQTVGYFEKGELKLLEVLWLGETGRHQLEYYFEDGALIFAFDQYFTYNRPIYWDETTASKNGDNEVFDPEKTTVAEDRYYFNGEKLFRWIDNTRKEVDLTAGTNILTSQGLISHCYKIKKELNKE